MSSSKAEWPPLLPQGLHSMSVEDVRQLCVNNFPDSQTRSPIMSGLEAYLTYLEKAEMPLRVWIDGSFVTKKVDPEDADVVVCAPGEKYDSGTHEQKAVLDYAAEAELLKPRFSCHSFVCYDYPPGHVLHALGEDDKAHWLDFFGTSRAKQPKGLILVKVGD